MTLNPLDRPYRRVPDPNAIVDVVGERRKAEALIDAALQKIPAFAKERPEFAQTRHDLLVGLKPRNISETDWNTAGDGLNDLRTQNVDMKWRF